MLKVGIATDLKQRLRDHGQSRQSGLKTIDTSQAMEPHNVRSKKSILAKHLWFDKTITKKYDLTTEFGRQEFLENECYIIVKSTSTREEARALEMIFENTGKYRYVGLVIWR